MTRLPAQEFSTRAANHLRVATTEQQIMFGTTPLPTCHKQKPRFGLTVRACVIHQQGLTAARVTPKSELTGDKMPIEEFQDSTVRISYPFAR